MIWNSMMGEFEKFTNMWELNNIYLNNQWFKREITSEFIGYFEISEDGFTTCQNPNLSLNSWDETPLKVCRL